ncbi:MAG TPA: hypothetical protein VFW62_04460, partial [bacterium]|nr:hypothetical protein [bacterium]
DSTQAEFSIQGLAADALFGDIEAVGKMGAWGRSHDAAIWELKDLFEMTWEPKLKPEDFGGFDVVRLREKIGEALRDSARQNPLAKKVIGDLENAYGVASLVEAAPALPSLPPPVPPPAPPSPVVLPPPQAAPAKSEVRVAAVKPAPPPKPVLSLKETIDQKIQAFLRPTAKKAYQPGLTNDISKLVDRLNPDEARELADKYLALIPEAIQSKDWSRILPLLHVTETLGPSLHPEVRSEFILRIGDLADQLMRLPEAFRHMVAFNYARTIRSKDTLQVIFRKRPTDSAELAELRKNLDQLRRVPHWDAIRGGPGLVRIYDQSRALGLEEAAAFRVELWGTLQLLYMDIVTRLKSNPDPHAAREVLTTISVLFRSLLGVTSPMEPTAREAFMDKAGFWRHGRLYRFQPFPGRFPEVLELEAEKPS